MASLPVTGTQVNYYFTCKRKLWLFFNYLEMEHTSDLVDMGRLIHESTYPRETKKEVTLDGIKIDFIDSLGVIHEIKKTPKVEEAHIWQLKYYLYALKERGVEGIRGELNYPKLKRVKAIELEEGDKERIGEILEDIRRIVAEEKPPEPVKIPICKNCSYFELCWV